jgi:hypothetical protein
MEVFYLPSGVNIFFLTGDFGRGKRINKPPSKAVLREGKRAYFPSTKA